MSYKLGTWKTGIIRNAGFVWTESEKEGTSRLSRQHFLFIATTSANIFQVLRHKKMRTLFPSCLAAVIQYLPHTAIRGVQGYNMGMGLSTPLTPKWSIYTCLDSSAVLCFHLHKSLLVCNSFFCWTGIYTDRKKLVLCICGSKSNEYFLRMSECHKNQRKI